MTTALFDPATLYRVRRGKVDIVDVPEFGYFTVDGTGAPEAADFAAAVQALYATSYATHFRLKKELGAAPGVGSLEALWWMDDPQQQALLAAASAGTADAAGVNRDLWRWRAMISQPAAVDAEIAQRAIAQIRAKRPSAALDRLRFQRWAEGRCAQVLYIGPYSGEDSSIAFLHRGIAAAGLRTRGHHHEIYLSDPRRTAAERLRTILRQPVEEPGRS